MYLESSLLQKFCPETAFANSSDLCNRSWMSIEAAAELVADLRGGEAVGRPVKTPVVRF